MKKLHGILFALGAVFLAYLVCHVGINELVGQMTLLGWGLVPFILCEGLSEFIHTAGWRHCLSGPHRLLPLGILFRIRMAGYAINYLTPTAAMGGEVTKAALLASRHRGPEAVSGVLIGKVCFAFAHLLFVVIGSAVCLWRLDLPRTLWLAMCVSGGLLGLGMVAFLMLQKHGKLGALVRWLSARKIGGAIMQKAVRGISGVDEALKAFYRERPGEFLKAVCWHLLGYSIGILQTWLFIHLSHQEAAWSLAAGLWFLGMWFDLITFAVPMNVGTLEGTRILALRAVGFSALMGITYGLAIRFAQLFWSVFGLVVYGLLFKAGVEKPVPGDANTSKSPGERRLDALARLDFDKLCREVIRKEDTDDFGCPPLTPALPLLLESLEREAALHPLGRFMMRLHLRDLLTTRLKLAKAWRAAPPGIHGNLIVKPIFIVGMPRSGSTFLHQLLAADPNNRAPRVWEVMHPTHYGSEASAIFKTEFCLWCFRRLVPQADSVYPMRARTPHECVAIHSYTFLSEEFLSTCRIPTYQGFLRAADLAPVYEWEKRFLQHLQKGSAPRRWVLKSPDHVYGLGALFATFPDAVVIQTHRNPLQVLASSTDLTQALHALYGEPADRAQTLAMEARTLADNTSRFIDFRDAHPELADRFIDISYSDLAAEPMRVVAQIYARLGQTPCDTTVQSMRQLASNRSQYRGPRASAAAQSSSLKGVLELAPFERYCMRFCLPFGDAKGRQ